MLKIYKKRIIIIWIILLIIIFTPAFAQNKGVTNVMVPGLDSISRGLPIIMYDHTEVSDNNKYIYLCGVLTEHEYYGYNDLFDEEVVVDQLYTPIFYKFSYEDGRLNYIGQWKYNTGVHRNLHSMQPFTGLSFYHVGRGTMYQNSSGGFDIISSASDYCGRSSERIKKLLILSFDQDGNLLSETKNLDTNLLLHDYQRNRNIFKDPSYIMTKEKKLYCLFHNDGFENYDGNKDPLNLYPGCWVALEFDSFGNYIKKRRVFSLLELSENAKYRPRRWHQVIPLVSEITFSDNKDNIYILANVRYSCNDSNAIWQMNRQYFDNLFIKLNKNLETEFYLFEKDITSDTTRDVLAMGAAIDKQDNVLISFMSFDNWLYKEKILQEMKENGLIPEGTAETSKLNYYIPPRDTLYYITKLSGETGEVVEMKKIDMKKPILSMKVKTTRDGNTYIYGSTYPRNPYLAKIDDDLNIEWITTEDISMADTLSDFIDLEPGHFALVGLLDNEQFKEPLIIEFSDNSSISDEQKRVNIQQYPNPAVEQVTISGSLDYIGSVSISIIDVNGHIVKTYDTYNNDNIFNYTFTVGELPSGTYYVLLRYDNQNIIDKLVITR